MASKYETHVVEDLDGLNAFLAGTDKDVLSVNSHGTGFIIVTKASEFDAQYEDWMKNIRVEPI